jgi:CubicO group peptidase (beta-lactamase class C family)
MKICRYFVIFLLLGLCGNRAGYAGTGPDRDKGSARNAVPQEAGAGPAWEWPVSTPEEQGLDPQPLAELVKLISEGERFPRLNCLLIVRNGFLVVEEYFRGFTADRIHTLQSVSKSFASALVGMAIAKGEFEGVEEKVLDFFPDMEDIANLDERKSSMRLRDLLTMRSGTDYHERGPDSPHFQLNALPTGWDRFYLDRPMLRVPGTFFLYDSGAVILSSSMLKNRTGMHADVYMDRFLFAPLQIEKKFWFKNQEGHPHTGGGLHLRPRDTARFGLLYLQGGRWLGEQVVPEQWVRESFHKHVDLGEKRTGTIGYGYWWWILAPDPDGEGEQNIFAAMGFRAQYIFVIPEHDMVVVVNGDTRSSADQNKPVGFLYSHILPSVRK